jgi:polygalacturonase
MTFSLPHIRASLLRPFLGVPRIILIAAFLFLVPALALETFVARQAVADPFHHTRKFCSLVDYHPDTKDAKKTAQAFERAFEDCAPGGTVVVPHGTWTTGPIKIPSHVTLQMNYGARLRFDSDLSLYRPPVATRFEGMDVMNYQPLLYVPDAEEVAIIGRGKFIGEGEEWWDRATDNEEDAAKALYKLAEAGAPVSERVFADPKRLLRPSFLQFYRSENLVVDGPDFINGPMWTIHPVYSKKVTIRNVRVETNGPNTDGIVIDSSEDVLVEHVKIASGDDAIALKSGLDDDGWREGRPTRHVVIRDFEATAGHGGITIGSEMSGGIEDVLVENATFHDLDTGIRIKTLKGRGGAVHNIRYRNISMENLNDNGIEITERYKFSTVESKSDRLPLLTDISIEGVRLQKAERALEIQGIEEAPLRNISIRDSSFEADKAGVVDDMDGGVFENVTLSTKKESAFELENVKNLRITGSVPDEYDNDDAYLNIDGERTENVEVHLAPCEEGACVRVKEAVPAGAVRVNKG